MTTWHEGRVSANGIEFAFLEQGEGPLALCVHGYPDTAYTWRHLLPELAAAGYRAVAPFNRGYAPTSLAADGVYQSGVLGADANALHEALGGDSDAVIIGHDYGAMAVYAAAHLDGSRWRKLVAAAVPPGPVVAEGFMSYEQLRMSWYIFFQLTPLADLVVGMNDYEFIEKLWLDWSPGFDPSTDLDHFRAAMPDHDHLVAALSYYRQTLDPTLQSPDYAEAQTGVFELPTLPLLYLHGENDGCMSSAIAAKSADVLEAPSRFEMIADAGHFLQLEQPETFNRLVLDFLAE